MVYWHRSVLLLLLGLALLGPATAGRAQDLAIKGTLGGIPARPKIVGNTAYLMEGSRLVIMDITDPAHPAVKSRTPLVSSAESTIDVIGTTLFRQRLGGGILETYDVSDPAAPVLRGQGIALYGGSPTELIALSPTSAIGSFTSNPRIVDLSDPNAPHVTCTLPYFMELGGGRPSVVVGGKYLVGNGGSNGLMIYELNGLTTPTLRSTYQVSAGGIALAVSGSRIYCNSNTTTGRLSIVDITDPANPVLKCAVDGYGRADFFKVTEDGKTLLARIGDTLKVFDVSDPTSPTTRSTLPLTPHPMSQNHFEFAYAGGKMCAADNHGYQFLDVSQPAAPAFTGRYDIPFFSVQDAAFVSDSLACVAGDGLQVVDLANPAAPKVVGRSALGLPAWSMQVSGQLALVLCNTSKHADFYNTLNPGQLKPHEFRIYDLSDPTSPTLKARIPVAQPTRLPMVQYYDDYCYANVRSQFGVLGQRVYLTDGSDSLKIYNIAQPEAPVLEQTVALPYPTLGFYLRGTSALGVTTDSQTIQLFDLSQPLAPRVVACYSPDLSSISIFDDPMYFGAWPTVGGTGSIVPMLVGYMNGPSLLRFISYNGVAGQRLLGEIEGQYSYCVTASPATCYAATYYEYQDRPPHFDVIDATHPDAPRVVASQDLYQPPLCVAASGRRALVGLDSDGLSVLDYSGTLGQNTAGKAWVKYP